MGKRVAIYPGSFDPPTLGHKYILATAGSLFDEVIVAIGVNPMKKDYWFNIDERVDMIQTIVSNMSYQDSFGDGLIGGEVDCKFSIYKMEKDYTIRTAEQLNANWIVRGVRSSSGYDEEEKMADYNYNKNSQIKTVLLPSPSSLKGISSSFVKSLVGYHGWEDEVECYLSKHLVEKFIERARERIS